MSSTERIKNTPEIGALKEVYRIYSNTEAVDFCKQVLGENEKPTDPVESVKEIGNMLADLRKTKANEVQ